MAWTTKSIVSQRAFRLLEHPVEIGHVGDVAFDQEIGADLGRERPDPLLERLALIGESELGALLGEPLRNPPGQRLVVGEAHDQAALSAHQSGHRCFSCDRRLLALL